MKASLLKMAILASLGVSGQVMAVGFEPLPPSPTGSAYINCFNDGRVIPPPGGPAVTAFQARANFGTLAPAGSTNTCEVTGLSNDLTAPKTGYTIVLSAIRDVTTGGVLIGRVTERIWRNTAGNMCIFGAKVNFLNADYDPSTAGTQYFEMNDLARGGFSSSGTVNVAYFIQATNASPVYRTGRSFTSVQHRALKYGGTILERQQNGTGYLDLPTIGGSPSLDINGVNSGISPTATASATAAQQEAAINSNWIDFTMDAGFQDDDGETNNVSAMTYVEAPCNNASAAVINDTTNPTTTWVRTGAIRLRQTAQENTTFKEILVDGYAPPGSTVP